MAVSVRIENRLIIIIINTVPKTLHSSHWSKIEFDDAHSDRESKH